jgi:hypothetical protein
MRQSAEKVELTEQEKLLKTSNAFGYNAFNVPVETFQKYDAKISSQVLARAKEEEIRPLSQKPFEKKDKSRVDELPRGTRISREDFRKLQAEQRSRDYAFSPIEQGYWDLLSGFFKIPKLFVTHLVWPLIRDALWPALKFMFKWSVKLFMAAPLIGSTMRMLGKGLEAVGRQWVKVPEVVRNISAFLVLAVGLPAAFFIPVLNGPMVFGVAFSVRTGEWPTPKNTLDEMFAWISWLNRVRIWSDENIVWPVERRARGFKK